MLSTIRTHCSDFSRFVSCSTMHATEYRADVGGSKAIELPQRIWGRNPSFCYSNDVASGPAIPGSEEGKNLVLQHEFLEKLRHQKTVGKICWYCCMMNSSHSCKKVLPLSPDKSTPCTGKRHPKIGYPVKSDCNREKNHILKKVLLIRSLVATLP